ncbi:MAG: DivIVA domain-containing protein [Intestinibacillus sp.]
MLTVQEIQAMNFEKAVFGGYDMKTVDEFIEQLTEDYATLQKENAALKSKMKVLVDKIEEYRSVEDGMRRALVSAQSIAQETIDKAKLEAEQLVTSAREQSEATLSSYRTKIQAEEQKLQSARRECADFIARMTAFYETQLQELVSASAAKDLQVAREPATAVTEDTQPLGTTRDLSKPVAKPEKSGATEKEYAIPEDIRKYMERQPEQEGMKVKMMEVTLSDDTASGKTDREQPADAAGKFSFGELKFGADYSTENDK